MFDLTCTMSNPGTRYDSINYLTEEILTQDLRVTSQSASDLATMYPGVRRKPHALHHMVSRARENKYDFFFNE